MKSETGRSTWRAMNPSVSLTSAFKRRRFAARTSSALSTTIGSMPDGIGAKGAGEPVLETGQVFRAAVLSESPRRGPRRRG